MFYAAKQFNTPLPVEEAAQAKAALESVEKLSFPPKYGQSSADTAAEKRKITNVAKEILAKF